MSLYEDLIKQSTGVKEVTPSAVVPEGNTTNLYESLINKATGVNTTEKEAEVEKEVAATGQVDIDDIANSRRIGFNFDKSGSIVRNFSQWLERELPLGSIGGKGGFYTSPDEKYGEGFTDMTPKDRRKVLIDYKQKQIEKEYPVLSSMLPSDSEAGWQAFVGVAGKQLTDPTTLVPFVGGVKGALGIGYTFGAAYSASEDLISPEGEIDLAAANKLGLYSALGSAVLVKVGQAVGKTLKNKKKVKEANKEMEQINAATSEIIASGAKPKELNSLIGTVLGRTKEELDNIVNTSTTPHRIPTRKAAVLEQELKNAWENPGKIVGLFDNLFGAVSTRIGNISKRVLGLMRNFEKDQSVNTHLALKQVAPFMKTMNRLRNKPLRKKVDRHLNNGNFKAAEDLMRPLNPTFSAELAVVRKLLDNTGKELNRVGHKFTKLENYYPRIVKDLKGLRKAVGRPVSNKLDDALRARAKSLKLASVRDLPAGEESKIISSMLAGHRVIPGGGKLSFTKQRGIPLVSEKIAKFYENPTYALDNYLRKSIQHIGKRKLLGSSAKETDISNKIDIEKSVSDLITRESAKGKGISLEGQQELVDLIQGRLGMGEVAPNAFLRFIRNMGYGAVLANPVSASTQVGDVGVSAAINGSAHTIKAMVGKTPVNMKSLGLDDMLNHELSTSVDTSIWLGRALQGAGFRAVDRYGKDVFLGAAHSKASKLVQSSGGIKVFSKKYKDMFGDDEFNLLVSDYQAGRVTDRVKQHLWNELSDAQPISLLEQSAAYINNPNARIFYMLKSFTLKQLDIARRGVYQEAKKGNFIEATKNAARLAVLVGGMNAGAKIGQRYVMSKGESEIELAEDMTDETMEFFWSMLGAGEFARDRYWKRGDVIGGVGSLAIPPHSWAKDVMQQSLIQLGAAEGTQEWEKAWRHTPVVGKMWYNFFGGGLEKKLDREEKERWKEMRENGRAGRRGRTNRKRRR